MESKEGRGLRPSFWVGKLDSSEKYCFLRGDGLKHGKYIRLLASGIRSGTIFYVFSCVLRSNDGGEKICANSQELHLV
jgi:hypothetical protein